MIRVTIFLEFSRKNSFSISILKMVIQLIQAIDNKKGVERKVLDALLGAINVQVGNVLSCSKMSVQRLGLNISKY